jgi:L-lysine exporter family protein LysE/ArgO
VFAILAIGFATSLALIVAIGAQNAFVLRQGIVREHVVPVALLCAASDAVLIGAGIGGLGSAMTAYPALLAAAKYGGAAFLLVYAITAARRALKPNVMTVSDHVPASRRTVILTCLAFTFLNPHVYLDTMVLLGSLANQYGADGRWLFGLGAVAGSFVWFFSLGLGARLLRAVFERARSWQVLDGLIALVMAALGVTLAVS